MFDAAFDVESVGDAAPVVQFVPVVDACVAYAEVLKLLGEVIVQFDVEFENYTEELVVLDHAFVVFL